MCLARMLNLSSRRPSVIFGLVKTSGAGCLQYNRHFRALFRGPFKGLGADFDKRVVVP